MKLNKYEDIIEASFRLIQAMIYEEKRMPKAFEAPNTVNAAGVLRERLVSIGMTFESVERKQGVK